ncbi:MAG TPA: helix-turn-helix domain-containing protein [Gemmataceae bacterium]|nr:helix-turn-helix domain-containing protein [Gemmataceae bacterium]
MSVEILDPEARRPAVLLDVKAVAALLTCSPRHVYRLVDTGKMPLPVRLGTLVRWPLHTIEQWLKDGCPAVRAKEAGK